MNAARFRYRPVAASQGAPKLHDNGALPSGIRRPVSGHCYSAMSIGARLDDTIVAAPAGAAHKLVGRPLADRARPDGNSHFSVHE